MGRGLDGPGEGGVPDVPEDAGPDYTLRDVLNAAWLCRIRSESSTFLFEEAAKNTCQRVMRQPRKEQSVSSGSITPFN